MEDGVAWKAGLGNIALGPVFTEIKLGVAHLIKQVSHLKEASVSGHHK